MRPLSIAFFILALSAGTGLAQEKPGRGSITTQDQSSEDRSESCVEVEAGGTKAFDCINRRLQEDAKRANPIPNIPPIDARSQDIRLGIVNGPAVKQQYGPSFGQSAVPFRP